MKMQVVVPMGGVGQRFLDAGYDAPKPLLKVGGEFLIKRLIQKFPSDARFVFPCNEDHLKKTPLRKVLLAAAPKGVIVPIKPHKKGPVYSVMQAASSIQSNLPTIVNYCDFSFSWDPDDFVAFAERTACDGAIFCYRGFHPHYLGNTLYAYCREVGGRISDVREKGHFTPDRTNEFASSGTYYFGSGGLMKKTFQAAQSQKLSLNGEYYVSLAYNPLIMAGGKVLVYEIPFMLQWGTPEDIEDYNYWHAVFAKFARRDSALSVKGPRLLMPMAGLGSRFKDTTLPKPMIPVMGRPMFENARAMSPARASDAVFVVREEVRSHFPQPATGQKWIALPGATRGQAETVLKGLAAFRDEDPVLVTACDHGLLWSKKKWDGLLKRGPDVVVFGQRGYPGARRTPKSYAYIEADPQSRIKRVSVKEPISARPQDDLLLVGTFYFRKAGQLREIIETLLSRGLQVNGEYYLDSAISIAVENKWDVRVFETEGYMNWGSPDALAEFGYWHRYFQGVPA